MAVDSTVQIDDQELTTNLNYLQPTGFRVLIDRTRYPNLEFFAQSVDHPSVNVNPVQLPVRRVTQVPLAGDKISYGELGMSIICLLYTSASPRDRQKSRMPSSA